MLHPVLGRFVSRDPISYFGGSTNLACYVANRPTVRVDPMGLQQSGPVSIVPVTIGELLTDQPGAARIVTGIGIDPTNPDILKRRAIVGVGEPSGILGLHDADFLLGKRLECAGACSTQTIIQYIKVHYEYVQNGKVVVKPLGRSGYEPRTTETIEGWSLCSSPTPGEPRRSIVDANSFVYKAIPGYELRVTVDLEICCGAYNNEFLRPDQKYKLFVSGASGVDESRIQCLPGSKASHRIHFSVDTDRDGNSFVIGGSSEGAVSLRFSE